jgi:uncharacterized protein involved in type VI secretion and phage assembly
LLLVVVTQVQTPKELEQVQVVLENFHVSLSVQVVIQYQLEALVVNHQDLVLLQIVEDKVDLSLLVDNQEVQVEEQDLTVEEPHQVINLQ